MWSQNSKTYLIPLIPYSPTFSFIFLTNNGWTAPAFTESAIIYSSNVVIWWQEFVYCWNGWIKKVLYTVYILCTVHYVISTMECVLRTEYCWKG